jgi:hypothetical protein
MLSPKPEGHMSPLQIGGGNRRFARWSVGDVA